MKTVLFICVHNAGRSQMAEAFFNQIAKGKAKAISAGSQPSENVNSAVVDAMREVGIDISQNKPKLLTLDIMSGIDKAITMGCENACPITTIDTEDWGLEDTEDKPIESIRVIREEIKNRVNNLLKNMMKE